MLVKSNTTGKQYDPSKVVRIINVLQIAAYLENEVELLDLYTSKDFKTGKPILVAVFDRQGSYEAYDKWCKHVL